MSIKSGPVPACTQGLSPTGDRGTPLSGAIHPPQGGARPGRGRGLKNQSIARTPTASSKWGQSSARVTATATADGRAGGAARGDADGGDPKKEKKQSLATNASFGAKNKDPVHKKHKTRVLILVRGGLTTCLPACLPALPCPALPCPACLPCPALPACLPTCRPSAAGAGRDRRGRVRCGERAFA